MDRVVNCTCGYCSTGCNLTVTLAEGKRPQTAARLDYPVNLGKACPKGFQFLGHLGAPSRATRPMVRDASGNLQPLSWHEAATLFVQRFKDIQARHGQESVAFLGTGQMVNEELAFFGALAKFGMGMLHGDGNTRQCMATAVTAYKESFGFDSPPFTYKDYEEADLMVFVGSNVVISHPIQWNRAGMNKRHARMVVLDPRRTETASGEGIIHYPIRPKSDIVVLYALARLLVERGWIERDFIERSTSGFEEFKSHVQQYDLDRASRESGLSPEQITDLAEMIHSAQRATFFWMVGINQGHQATRTAQAIINLALMTGNIGRPGTGPNSITGQANAMGSRLFANSATLFCGRDNKNPTHRQEVADALHIDVNRVPPTPSLSYEKIFEAVDQGKIKGLWIACTNPGHSWVDRNGLRQALKKAEFIVVQDMFWDTETAHYAHLILPAAGCGEKDGTFINSERRIGLVQKVQDPPGEAIPDFFIFQRLAEYWGCAEMFHEWTSPAEAFQILKRLAKGRPCDISGIENYEMLDRYGGIQWPFREGDDPAEKERRLFEDGRFFHPDGKARFIFEDAAAPPDAPNAEYQFILMTGRGSVSQWHTLTRSDRSPVLKKISPLPDYVQMNPADAARLGIQDQEWVVVSAPRGEATARAKVSDAIQPGQLFMPMHFVQTNNLTFPAFDSYSRQPSYKYAAVRVSKIE